MLLIALPLRFAGRSNTDYCLPAMLDAAVFATNLAGMNSAVKSAFNAFPAPGRARLLEVRGLILAAADATDTAPLTETLKWGQPAYLPARRAGTTLRLGLENPDTCALYVHCQTTLIDQYRARFPKEFKYLGNRAVLLPAAGRFAQAALQQIAALALTYHRDKARAG